MTSELLPSARRVDVRQSCTQACLTTGISGSTVAEYHLNGRQRPKNKQKSARPPLPVLLSSPCPKIFSTVGSQQKMPASPRGMTPTVASFHSSTTVPPFSCHMSDQERQASVHQPRRSSPSPDNTQTDRGGSLLTSINLLRSSRSPAGLNSAYSQIRSGTQRPSSPQCIKISGRAGSSARYSSSSWPVGLRAG